MTLQLSHTDLRILLGGVVVAGLLIARATRSARLDSAALGLAAIVGFAGFYNFGLMFHQREAGFLHRWDLFHYQLGAKYFPELGYDGLYAASLLAQRETAPELPVSRLRDLDTNRVVSPREHAPKLREVRARFSDARWREFVADHRDYLDHTPPEFWREIRRDHGYNPTPAWTFVARLAGARLPASNATLGLLASLDMALMAVAFALIFRSFGFAAGCLALAIAGLGFGWRFMYIGALLRLDWLAASAIAVCLLDRKRFAAAGACIGYAASVRLFPILLALGPALLALKAWRAGERPRWPLRFAGGLLAVGILAIAAGSATGRGFAAWSEFAEDIRIHQGSWATNQIGLDALFLCGPACVLRGFSEAPPARTRAEVRRTLDSRRALRLLAAGGMLAALGLAAWGSSPAGATVLSIGGVFALTPAGAYYWILAMLVPLRGGRRASIALLALYTTLYLLSRLYPEPAHHAWLYAVLAWGTGAVLLAWILPDVLRRLRRDPGPGGA